MTILVILFLILAFACFFFAAVRPPQPPLNLIALGLMFWVLSVLVPALASQPLFGHAGHAHTHLWR